jgi:hypothetical protein
VQEAKIGPDNDIPHVTAPIIIKYVTELQLLGLLSPVDELQSAQPQVPRRA